MGPQSSALPPKVGLNVDNEEDNGSVESIMVRVEAMIDKKLEAFVARLEKGVSSVLARGEISIKNKGVDGGSYQVESVGSSPPPGMEVRRVVTGASQESSWAKVVGRKSRRRDRVQLASFGSGGS